MTEEKKSPGIRRKEILDAEMRIAASKRNDPCHAFIQTARRLLAESPDMPPAEKRAHHNGLKHEIEMMNERVHLDCSHVLGEIAGILGISQGA